MITAFFLLLGSNQGDRSKNLSQARLLLGNLTGTVTCTSGVYQTAAWGMEEQPDFYNQVLKIESTLAAEGFLKIIHRIESDMGRIRSTKWGPRIIDIDILFAGSQRIRSSELTIPHPGIPERRFTLVPLHEIAPEFIHPALNKSIRQLLAECKDPLTVTRVVTGDTIKD